MRLFTGRIINKRSFCYLLPPKTKQVGITICLVPNDIASRKCCVLCHPRPTATRVYVYSSASLLILSSPCCYLRDTVAGVGGNSEWKPEGVFGDSPLILLVSGIVAFCPWIWNKIFLNIVVLPTYQELNSEIPLCIKKKKEFL